MAFPVAYSLYSKVAKFNVIFTCIGASAICRVPMMIYEVPFSFWVVNQEGEMATREETLQTLAAEPGFEPGLRDPKSPVLPLHNSAILPKVGLEPT